MRNFRAQGKQLGDVVGQLVGDSNASVAAWARMIQVAFAPAGKRSATLKEMAASEYWPEHLLAATAA